MPFRRLWCVNERLTEILKGVVRSCGREGGGMFWVFSKLTVWKVGSTRSSKLCTPCRCEMQVQGRTDNDNADATITQETTVQVIRCVGGGEDDPKRRKSGLCATIYAVS